MLAHCSLHAGLAGCVRQELHKALLGPNNHASIAWTMSCYLTIALHQKWQQLYGFNLAIPVINSTSQKSSRLCLSWPIVDNSLLLMFFSDEDVDGGCPSAAE